MEVTFFTSGGPVGGNVFLKYRPPYVRSLAANVWRLSDAIMASLHIGLTANELNH